MKEYRASYPLRVLNKAIICAVAGALALPINFSAHAANHALTAVVNVNTIDYVVNVDWDFDNPPVQANNPSQVLDRAYITSVMRVVAQSVFTMTEGRHRLGNIFVYRNKQFGNNVNIQMINTNGRSSAHVSGLNSRNSSSFNHLAYNGTPETIEQLGKVIAHELGHYSYGLYDEYVEAGKPLDPADLGSPSQTDNPKNTMMNDHLAFVSFSTPADYADPSTRQTAQARIMATGTGLGGGSAWETLTRQPEQDPPNARGQGRTFFEAFRGINPATLQLTKPVAGFDRSLNMVFAPSPQFRDVIVVDRTLAPERFADLIQAAKALVGQAKDDTQFAIIASPAVGGTVPAAGVVRGYTDSTLVGKQTLGAALDALQPVQTGTFDTLASFTQAYGLLAAARKPGDMSTLHLLTGAEAKLPVEAATSARLAKVSVNPLGLTGGAAGLITERTAQARTQSAASSAVGLAQLADMTGGSFNRAATGAEAAKDAVRAINETHAAPFASLTADASPPLNAGGTFNSSFTLASGAVDGEVATSLFFDPRDAAKLRFSLVAPNGTVYSTTSLTAGIAFDIDAAYGEAVFVIAANAPNRVGKWTVRAQASALTVDGVGLEVSSDSLITLTGEIRGGLSGDTVTPALYAKLGSEKSIKGAVVTADIYDADGKLVLADVVLKDDGVLPDARAGDGQYAVNLAGLLPAGEYTAFFKAATNASSRIASLGALIKGVRDEESTIELIGRVSEFGFALDAGAPGVKAATAPVPMPTTPPVAGSGGGTTTVTSTTTSTTSTTTTSSSTSSGGCSVNPQGNDAGLAMLLLAALAGVVMRRRPARRRALVQTVMHDNSTTAR